MKSVKIFGREPSVLVSVVEAFLALLLSMNALGLDANSVSLWMAAIVAALGLYTAYVTRETLLSAGTGFAKAALILAVAYGLPLNENQTVAVISFITITLGYVLRSQNAPLEKPTFKYEPVTV